LPASKKTTPVFKYGNKFFVNPIESKYIKDDHQKILSSMGFMRELQGASMGLCF